MTIKHNILPVVFCLMLTACHSDRIYFAFKSLPDAGWNKDSLLTYTYEVQDTTASYDILLHIRHNERYPYQNLWLYIVHETEQTFDTIEFYLADDRGRWLGNGRNGTREMPVILEENYRFTQSGNHTLTIRHGMRQDKLKGVMDVGVEISSHEQE